MMLLLLLVFPAVQKEFSLVQIRELDGDFILAEEPDLNLNDWMEGKFQSAFERYIDDHIGFRNSLVRLNNQLDYSLYRIPHADGIVVGKGDQMFEYDYIREFIGNDFIGENVIDKKMRKLRFLQQYLKREKDIDLVLVFEPGKASFYPEYIPDRFLKGKKGKRNSEEFRKKADKYGIEYIDFDLWYRNDLKGKSAYPLYAPYGIHWSTYGSSFAADSLLNYIESVRQIDLVNATVDSLTVNIHANRPDYDVGRALNLMWRLPETDSLAYPVFSFGDTTSNAKPMVLTVGDSYYWNIFNTRIPKHIFGNEAFWYFNSAVYPDTYLHPVSVVDLNLKDEIEKQDVIFLMVTGRFLYKFGWSFIENVYKLYAPNSEFDKEEEYAEEIRDYSVWFEDEIAKKKKLSLEEKISEDARYVYQTEDIESYLTYYGIVHFEDLIRKNKAWLDSKMEQAKALNISVDKIVYKEAKGLFKTQYPDIFKKYQALQEAKSRILNDSILLEKTIQKAEYYYLTLEEMLQIEAEEIVDTELDKNKTPLQQQP